MPKPPPVYDQYSRPPDPGTSFEGTVSRTKQEFAAECDLNTIMARYTQTGELPAGMVGTYGDFSEVPDYLEAQIIIARADAQFSALPAEVRARFENDPAKFLDFVHDPDNLEELQKLGMLSEEGSAKVAAAKASAANGGSGETPPVSAKVS